MAPMCCSAAAISHISTPIVGERESFVLEALFADVAEDIEESIL